MPQWGLPLADGVVGEVGEVLCGVGDAVEKDEPVLIIETDKVSATASSSATATATASASASASAASASIAAAAAAAAAASAGAGRLDVAVRVDNLLGARGALLPARRHEGACHHSAQVRHLDQRRYRVCLRRS